MLPPTRISTSIPEIDTRSPFSTLPSPAPPLRTRPRGSPEDVSYVDPDRRSHQKTRVDQADENSNRPFPPTLWLIRPRGIHQEDHQADDDGGDQDNDAIVGLDGSKKLVQQEWNRS